MAIQKTLCKKVLPLAILFTLLISNLFAQKVVRYDLYVKDTIVNFEGKKDAYLSATETYKYWKMPSFSKETKKTINKVPNDDTTIEILESSNTNKTVTLISIENGGHTWPGANDFNIGLPIGKTSKELDINEYMWKFFESQN